jgi:hypothetical protein
MRSAIARAVSALSLIVAMFGLLGGTASQAGTRCEEVSRVGFVCLTTPPTGVEIYRAEDAAFQNVVGLGIECYDGHYYAQYQLGDPSTYRPVALFDLGTTCPVVS